MQEIEKKPEQSKEEKLEEGLPDNIEELKALLTKEREKSQNYLSSWQRAAADLINYRKRAEQEKAEAGNIASSILISKILPVIDDIDRALACNPDGGMSLDSLLEGMKNIQRKFMSLLESEGLSPVRTVGETFDPAIHEAVTQGEGEPGKVIGELRKGYRFNDRVLRPALVVVGREKGEDRPGKVEAAEEKEK